MSNNIPVYVGHLYISPSQLNVAKSTVFQSTEAYGLVEGLIAHISKEAL